MPSFLFAILGDVMEMDDILDIVNSFIKNKNEIDVEKVIGKLNNGSPIIDLMLDYQLTEVELKNKISEAGFIFNEQNQKWEKSSQVVRSDEAVDNLQNLIEKASKIFEQQNKEKFNYQSGLEKSKIDKPDKKNPTIKIGINDIVKRLNEGEGIIVIAQQYQTTVDNIKLAIKEEGYRYDEFYKIWTQKDETALLEEVINKLNSGNTMYDISNDYTKQKRERLLFSDALRRKIEKTGYSWSSKKRKWIRTQKEVEKNNDISSACDIGKSENGNGDRQVTSHEIVEKLRAGKSLKEIEKETSLTAQQMRILLKRDGYRYDGFFKTWINGDLLNEIESDITNKKKTLDEIADYYQISKEALYKHLINLGYQIKEKKEVKEENTRVEVKKIEEKGEAQKIRENTSKVIQNVEAESYSSIFSDSEIRILKDLIREKKDHQDNKNQGRKKINLYLSEDLLEVLEEQAEINSISKSVLVEKALKGYLENLKMLD